MRKETKGLIVFFVLLSICITVVTVAYILDSTKSRTSDTSNLPTYDQVKIPDLRWHFVNGSVINLSSAVLPNGSVRNDTKISILLSVTNYDESKAARNVEISMDKYLFPWELELSQTIISITDPEQALEVYVYKNLKFSSIIFDRIPPNTTILLKVNVLLLHSDAWTFDDNQTYVCHLVLTQQVAPTYTRPWKAYESFTVRT